MSDNKKSQKQLQISEQVKRVLAQIFAQDDNLQTTKARITILEADISPDIKNAKIFVDIYGDINKAKLIKELNKVSPYVRNKLSNRLEIRHTPQITFILDESGDNADNILNLVSEESEKFK